MFVFSDFLQAVVRVVRNPIYSLMSLSTCLNLVGVAGMLSFLPKYFASQYSVPLWKANIILGMYHIKLCQKETCLLTYATGVGSNYSDHTQADRTLSWRQCGINQA